MNEGSSVWEAIFNLVTLLGSVVCFFLSARAAFQGNWSEAAGWFILGYMLK